MPDADQNETGPNETGPNETGTDPTPAAEQAPATTPKVTKTTRTRARKAPAAPVDAATAEQPASTDPEQSAAAAEPEKPVKKAAAKKAAAKKAPAAKTAAKKSVAKKTTKKAAAKGAESDEPLPELADPTPEATSPTSLDAGESAVAATAPAVTKTTRSRRTAKKTAPAPDPVVPDELEDDTEDTPATSLSDTPAAATMPLFQAPEKTTTVTRRTRGGARKRAESAEAETEATLEAVTSVEATADEAPAAATADEPTPDEKAGDETTGDTTDAETETEAEAETEADTDEQSGGGRRRRRRGGRRRRRSGDGGSSEDESSDTDTDEESAGRDESGGAGSGAKHDDRQDDDQDDSDDDESGDGSSRRRRRRRPRGESGGSSGGGDQSRERRPRNAEDEITSVAGSTRLEAKKQRRREGREAGRRRAPIVSEAEFLARRESVDRTMVIRQRDDLTQIGVLEDKVLVEHYVARESQTSLIGNVYLGRVQNVLPSMEAAFIDIGKGRNAVLYAGEVNWTALGHKDGQPRKIESVLSSGQTILVQVTKDPVGHKGARLTSQVSLAGRFLVYVPDGTTSGISRKLPDTERHRLKTLLKEIVPESAGVIVRTAAEGASELELTSDVERLKARWEDIESKLNGGAPTLLYGEPDLTLKVVRDLFTEDFATLIIQGDDAWDTVQNYVAHVAPDLEPRLQRYLPAENAGRDLFATYRVDEQIAKGLDRKVWLPSGGSLVIDRTEAMTVVDVNTGKFTGSGGNLEETVTKNNLESAEEIVRQLRLRDIGGIIVVDFIDMVLESNRDLVLRRLVECLGRDRTRHQVAEVTSLGLVQMTRKRIGTGLLEAFSESCTHCQGRGLVLHDQPVESSGGGGNSGSGSNGSSNGAEDEPRRGRRRGGRGRSGGDDQQSGDTGGSGSSGGGGNGGTPSAPSPAFVAAIARAENADAAPLDGLPTLDAEVTPALAVEIDDATTAESAPSVPTDTTESASDAPTDTTESAPDAPVEATESAGEAALPVEDQEVQDVQPVQDTETDASPLAPDADASEPGQGAGFPDGTEPTEPEQPTVLTRTRRRSATRPAGPPPGSVTPESVVIDPDAAPVAVASVDTPVVEHVPIKRKGARKR